MRPADHRHRPFAWCLLPITLALLPLRCACPANEVCTASVGFAEAPLLADGSVMQRASGGFIPLDYDNDGDLDLVVLRGFTFHDRIRQSDPATSPLLLRNDGEQFTDVSEAAGVTVQGWFATGVAGDFNHDGLDDFLVAGVDPRDGQVTDNSPDYVYLNLGDGTFEFLPLDLPAGVTLAACTADFDGDGQLDLFLANEQDRDNRACDNEGSCGAYGQRDDLYVGRGDGTFERATERAGALATKPGMWSDGCLVFDHDDDGDVDLFVAHKYGGIGVFRNDGALNFTDVSEETLGPDAIILGQWMGFALVDTDVDGDEDLFATNWGTSHFSQSPSAIAGEEKPYRVLNALFRNLGGGEFEEVAAKTNVRCLEAPPDTWQPLPEGATGVAATEFGWAASSGDYDLDGRPDLFFAGALAFSSGGQIIGDRDRGANPGRLLHSTPEGFDEVGAVEGIVNTNAEGFILDAMGVGLLDLSGTGTLDILIGNQWFGEDAYPGGVRRFSPRSRPDGHWVGVILRGTTSNPNGIGAKVTVRTDAGEWRAHAASNSAFSTNPSGRLHFGLGGSAAIQEVEIRWPAGTYQTITGLGLDRWHVVEEPIAPGS